MARFYGMVGYGVMTKTGTGIVEEVITEREYYGDVVRHYRQNQTSETLNDDLNVSNEISIVADDYAFDHAGEFKYVKWGKTRWKIKSFEVDRPRLILQLGGVYNGKTP